MLHQAYWLECTAAASLYLNCWQPEQPPNAVIMLAHGMAEHSARYARLAQQLCDAGYAVYAHDQRGHGQSALEHGVLGHFADQNGWAQVIEDLNQLNHHIRRQHPQAPIFLVGHSMGSYISMAYLMHHSCSVQGAVLSGSNYQPVWLYWAAQWVARFERFRQGPLGRSRLLQTLSFGSFNNAFKPNRTPFDWLSRDPAEVDRYLNDPLCGLRCTNQLWIDLLGGLQHITPVRHLRQINSDLPLLIIGGSCDPVSRGQRQHDLANALRSAGQRNLQIKIYPDARHEVFNETNRDEVSRDLINWFNQLLNHPHTHTPFN